MVLLTQLLEDEYEVLTAIDGSAGVEMAARERASLILTDLSLPVMDGRSDGASRVGFHTVCHCLDNPWDIR